MLRDIVLPIGPIVILCYSIGPIVILYTHVYHFTAFKLHQHYNVIILLLYRRKILIKPPFPLFENNLAAVPVADFRCFIVGSFPTFSHQYYR